MNINNPCLVFQYNCSLNMSGKKRVGLAPTVEQIQSDIITQVRINYSLTDYLLLCFMLIIYISYVFWNMEYRVFEHSSEMANEQSQRKVAQITR